MRFNPDEYVSVSERVERFYAKFPTGRILTAVVEHNAETGTVLMRAEVYRDPADTLPAATGHAYELKGGAGANATSHIENCETSAVGRALALLGFEVKRGAVVRPAGTLTAQIMGRLDVLDRDTAWLNSKVRPKYGLAEAASWTQLPEAHKGEVLAWLTQMVEKQVEKAKA